MSTFLHFLCHFSRSHYYNFSWGLLLSVLEWVLPLLILFTSHQGYPPFPIVYFKTKMIFKMKSWFCLSQTGNILMTFYCLQNKNQTFYYDLQLLQQSNLCNSSVHHSTLPLSHFVICSLTEFTSVFQACFFSFLGDYTLASQLPLLPYSSLRFQLSSFLPWNSPDLPKSRLKTLLL